MTTCKDIEGGDYTIDTNEHFVFSPPEFSEWRCYLFGGSKSDGISWRPLKGKEPNWFWRKMQYLCFGNKWVRESE